MRRTFDSDVHRLYLQSVPASFSTLHWSAGVHNYHRWKSRQRYQVQRTGKKPGITISSWASVDSMSLFSVASEIFM